MMTTFDPRSCTSHAGRVMSETSGHQARIPQEHTMNLYRITDTDGQHIATISASTHSKAAWSISTDLREPTLLRTDAAHGRHYAIDGREVIVTDAHEPSCAALLPHHEGTNCGCGYVDIDQANSASEAEAMARVTGSRGCTVIRERRSEDGTLTEVSRETWGDINA